MRDNEPYFVNPITLDATPDKVRYFLEFWYADVSICHC